MTIPEMIVWILGLVIIPAVIFFYLRAYLKKPPYKFKMVFRTPGVDQHFTVYGASLNFKHKVGDQEYEIKAERLYRYKPGIARKMLYKFRGIKESFFIVYQHNKTEALSPIKVKVSARMLKVVSESQALDKALRSEFKVPWDLKKIVMVIGFLVVAVIVWIVISGDISL